MNMQNIGQKIADPTVNQDGFFKPLLCECDESATCEDKFTKTMTAAQTVTGFTFNDKVVVLPTPIAASNEIAIATALYSEIKIYESQPFVGVKYENGVLTVKHWGKYALTAVTTSAGAMTVAARNCVPVSLCKSSRNISGSGIVLKTLVGGVVSTYTLAGTYTTYTAAGAATLKADIETALVSEITSGLVRMVKVKEDAINGFFTVQIESVSGFRIFEGSNEFSFNSCREAF